MFTTLTTVPANGCAHNDPLGIVQTREGEHVCGCGVVLQERTVEQFYQFATAPVRVSLYHQVENGGSPVDMKVVNKRIHIHSAGSSEFSNICGKLEIQDCIQGRAWHIYRMLRSHTDHTRAKCAAFAIFVACREGDRPTDESRIREAIRSVMCIKNIPGMLAVISELHEDAKRLGVDTNDGHSPQYYLNAEISKRQDLFWNPRKYDRFKSAARENFELLHGNSRSRARRAAVIALCEVGVVAQ